MATFFENPLFLFVDEAEPILPIFRSPEYSDSGRKIVELADVGCDTETTFPIHFLRSKFNQRRGGTEGFESARKITKGRNEKSTNFSAHVATIDDFEDRKEKYVEGKPWQNYRNDVCSADLDCNSCADNFYDDWEFNTAGYNDYYTNFVTPQNMTGRFRKERLSQDVQYSKNYEAPFSRGNRASQKRDEAYCQRINTCSLWSANSDERNAYEIRNTDNQSRRLPLSEHRKCMRIFSEVDDFNHDAGSRKNRVGPERRRREDASFDYINSVRVSKNNNWHFTSLENEPNYEESISSNLAAVNNHRHLREVISQNLDLQQAHVNVANSENSEFTKTHEKNSSSKNPIKDARYQVSKSDATMEKLKTYRRNLPDTNTPRVRSAAISTDQRLLNMRFMEKAATNVRLRSAVEERKNDASNTTPTERRAETANSTLDKRPHCGNGQVRPYSRSVNKIGCSAKSTFRLAASRNNERMCRRNNAGSRVKSANKCGEIDRADRTIPSRSTPEEVTESAGISISGLPSTSPRAEAEKKRKISRLPVRIWKRMRTRELTALHLESETMSGDVGGKLQDVNIILESAQLHKPSSAEDNEEREEMARDHTSRRRDDLKPNERYKTGVPHVADKPGSALGDLKGTKNLNISKGTSEQRRKRTS